MKIKVNNFTWYVYPRGGEPILFNQSDFMVVQNNIWMMKGQNEKIFT